MNVFYIALGANLPFGEHSPLDTLQGALNRLNVASTQMIAASDVYRTPCFPEGAGPDFVNAVAKVMSDLKPTEMLEHLHALEGDLGRERKSRWGARTVDLDLLAAGDLVLPNAAVFRHWMELAPDQQRVRAPDTLILPHPRLHERAFVLVPWRDIAADWVHPVLNKTVAEMCAALPPDDVAAVIKLVN
ncbi:2-amino-4-hydroxy-6-hydroxymethyldihydropteridine diphosphokinase [Marivita hallyeonensis]|uniref:2-amino-4-hydroxy-6-hydroxymethyldihydropteridine pyrophosphokinase n=1 Tax=Marivita hallyeonensis TaxID=996342 RepID=A0A1M5XBF2_9RHOB|nr:2-amino-4-hydroxy-6-hydroxymethyldihydropteridine diphosphokinase [Marivita hallyeonensis]SHH97106.1 2-amino-4-hydroxy-6-hydroxymethyldihydropteridinediphosphokinase [Marivita hallyeonensis]